MKPLTRRAFLRLCGTSSIGFALAACAVAPSPTTIPTTAPAPAPTNTSVPTATAPPTSTPLPTATNSPAATNTPRATATPAPVPAPGRGLGSNSNYYLASDCAPVTGLTVTVEVTKDIVSDIGFSFQLNCYSPLGANSIWQQYIMIFDTSDGSPLKISAMVDNWPSDSLKQALNEPEHTDLINSGGQAMLTLPGAALPAGYKLMISLEYDKDQNVNGAKYVVMDTKGKSTVHEFLLESFTANHSNPPKRITSAELAPIYAFELNLVGNANGKNTFLSTGAGTFTYTASSPLTVMNNKPACCAAQGVFTAETANCAYGTLFAGPSQAVTQSFDTVPPSPYPPGAALAVSPLFGTTQTALFAVTGFGQLGEFDLQGDGRWHSTNPKGPQGMARPGAAVAVSRHFGVDNQTDVLLFDQNGHLNVFSAKNGANWTGPQTIRPGNAGPSGAKLAASQHFGTANQTDLFVVDPAGQLSMFWAVGSGAWKGPQPIGAAGFAHPAAALAVSQRFGIPNQTDVFVVDTNGQLNVFSADAAGHWRGPQPIGPAGLAPTGAALTVSQRFGATNQTDVYLVDTKGQVNVFSVDGAGPWNGPETVGAAGFAHSGAALSVLQDPVTRSQTDVFLIDKNGQLNMFWADGTGHWNGPQSIGAAGLAPSEAVVVASSQPGAKHQTDVFFINQTGVKSPGWPTVFEAGDSGTWNGPKALVNEI
jgi:hypothetical protein